PSPETCDHDDDNERQHRVPLADASLERIVLWSRNGKTCGLPVTYGQRFPSHCGKRTFPEPSFVCVPKGWNPGAVSIPCSAFPSAWFLVTVVVVGESVCFVSSIPSALLPSVVLPLMVVW